MLHHSFQYIRGPMNEPRLSDSSDSNDILYSPDEISLLVEISRRFYVDDASKLSLIHI